MRDRKHGAIFALAWPLLLLGPYQGLDVLHGGVGIARAVNIVQTADVELGMFALAFGPKICWANSSLRSVESSSAIGYAKLRCSSSHTKKLPRFIGRRNGGVVIAGFVFLFGQCDFLVDFDHYGLIARRSLCHFFQLLDEFGALVCIGRSREGHQNCRGCEKLLSGVLVINCQVAGLVGFRVVAPSTVISTS